MSPSDEDERGGVSPREDSSYLCLDTASSAWATDTCWIYPRAITPSNSVPACSIVLPPPSRT